MTRPLPRNLPLIDLLRHCPILEGIQPEACEELAEQARFEELHAKQTLAEEGSPASKIYFILRGRIEVRMESVSPNVEVPVGRLGSGDVLGERLLLGESTWSETAVAITAGEALIIPVPHLRTLLCRDTETAAMVYASVARSLARRLDLSQQRVMNVVRRTHFSKDET